MLSPASWSRKWQPDPVFLLENSMDREAWWAQSTWSQRVRHKLSIGMRVCARTHTHTHTHTKSLCLGHVCIDQRETWAVVLAP